MSNIKKTKTFSRGEEVTDESGLKHIIFVYGEMNESNYIDALEITPIKMTRKRGRIAESKKEDNVILIPDGTTYAPVKTFNMGWAICDASDEFDEAQGIKQAKKRFAKSPLKTQNGNFLTADMCYAIVKNEVNYIKENISHFLNKFKK